MTNERNPSAVPDEVDTVDFSGDDGESLGFISSAVADACRAAGLDPKCIPFAVTVAVVELSGPVGRLGIAVRKGRGREASRYYTAAVQGMVAALGSMLDADIPEV